jgi:putative flippase GtrA
MKTKFPFEIKYLSNIKNKVFISRVFIWLAFGLFITLLSTLILYFFVESLEIHLPIATALSGEISLLIRYFLNNYFVFNKKSFKLMNCLKFHIAMLLGFSIWWILTNILSVIGLHYIIAALSATLISTLINLITNFKWVWGKN